MFENHNKYLELLMSIVKENNVTTSAELQKLLYNEDGSYREEVVGNTIKEMKEDMEPSYNNSEPTDLSDLTNLSDDELYDSLPEILFDDDLCGAKKIAHIAYEFDMEFGNGGVSQYFANTRGEHALELAESLEKVGATKYAKACDEFIKQYNIKPEDFNDNIKNYFDVAESMYPYDELESAIEELYMTDLLQDYIVKYVRENASDIF